MSEVTQTLDRAQQGDPKAAEELLPLVYDELRRLAAHKMANEAAGHTLQPTALVHEAWLRLTGEESARFQNRAHFFGAAAEAMRRILVESARRKSRLKHGGDVELQELDESLIEAQVVVSRCAAQCASRKIWHDLTRELTYQYARVMSLAELKEQASVLPVDEQAELAAYLAERLRCDDPAYRAELARLIEDRDPAHWARWNDVKREPAE